jgi:uncharacterized protein YndB with AHSA1/START domain
MQARNEQRTLNDVPPLLMSRIFPASRDLVFRAWSSAEHLKHWFCPEGYSVPEVRVDFKVGGSFDLCMRSAAGEEHWMKGKYTEIVPNTRLGFESCVGPDDHPLFSAQTLVTFDQEQGGSTRLTVKQTYTIFDAVIAASMIQGAPQGWAQTLDRLEKEVLKIRRTPPVARSVAHGSFTIERTFAASRAQVFEALTDPAAKAKWFSGGSGYTVVEREMDARPGGREHQMGRWENGVVSTFDAYYHDVVPEERLVYSYVMHLNERKISASLATFEFHEAGSGTRLIMTEHGAFLDGYDDAGSRERGSNFLLDSLGRSLEG